jgi:ribose transport system ATP-binding protein
VAADHRDSGGREAPPALVARNFSKSFAGARALSEAHLTVYRGEVHGLVGENGSGKSTFIKILAGFHAPDPGAELYVDGQPIDLPLAPGRFRDLGMAFVHQHLALIPSVTVLENLIMLKLSSGTGRFINWARERRRARALLERFDMRLDLDARVGQLGQVERAMLAIVRAASEIAATSAADADASGGSGLLILDEPTVFLSEEGLQRLYRLIREVVADGSSVIFVSHDLDEIRELTDRATVLRDGEVIGTVESASASKAQLVSMIIGHDLEDLKRDVEVLDRGDVALEVRNLRSETKPVEDVTFDLHAGEVLGLTGLVGSGFHEVLYLLYGVWSRTSGRMRIGPAEHDLASFAPVDALAAGMALIPADRQRDGSIGSLSVADNVTMQVLGNYFSGLMLHDRAMQRDTGRLLHEFDVRPGRPELLYQSLSGGNQQKALLAKWLQTEPSILLLHEPTQGVDVGARLQIFETIRRVAGGGTAVLCASSDYEQLEQICDRVLILGSGRVVRELSGANLTKARITEQSLTAVHARHQHQAS